MAISTQRSPTLRKSAHALPPHSAIRPTSCASSRKIATLQPISVACPPDAPTTFGEASRGRVGARMNRLASRLQELAEQE